MSVVVREPAGAADERAKQLAELRAFMQRGARGVALENIPTTPSRPASEQPDTHEEAAEAVKAGVQGGVAAHGPRPTSAQGRAAIRRRSAALAAAHRSPTAPPSNEPSGLSDEELQQERDRLEQQLPGHVETPSRPYTEAEQAIVNRHSKVSSEIDSRDPVKQKRKRELAEDYAAKAQKRQQPGYLQDNTP